MNKDFPIKKINILSAILIFAILINLTVFSEGGVTGYAVADSGASFEQISFWAGAVLFTGTLVMNLIYLVAARANN